MRAVVDALSVEMVVLVHGAGDNAAQPAERFADGIRALVDLATRHPLLLDFVSRLGVSTLGSDVLKPALAAERLVDVIAPEAAGDLSPNLARGFGEAATLALPFRVKVRTPVNAAGFVAAVLRALGHPPTEASRLAARPFTPLTIPTDSLIVRSESARSRGAELGRKPG